MDKLRDDLAVFWPVLLQIPLIRHDSFQNHNSCSPPWDFHSLQTQLPRSVFLPGTRDRLLAYCPGTGVMVQTAHSHCHTLLWRTLCSLLSVVGHLPFPQKGPGSCLEGLETAVVCGTLGASLQSDICLWDCREERVGIGGNSTYRDWEGLPLGALKETQYRPMLSPLIHTSPLPILIRFSATASFPVGVGNVVWVTEKWC